MTCNDRILSKIVTKEKLASILHVWRFKEEQIVFTNGCFDILHRGHIDYLSKARDLGTKLIVGLNTDESIKQLNKGTERPIQNEQTRAEIIASLFFVDAVILFNEPTPLEIIKFIKPHILVKGSDYKPNQVVGKQEVEQLGGKLILIDFLPGYSTTSIISKIKNA
jgi:rfaE bifunctional protein nucleotidyltransferase chain/domain